MVGRQAADRTLTRKGVIQMHELDELLDALNVYKVRTESDWLNPKGKDQWIVAESMQAALEIAGAFTDDLKDIQSIERIGPLGDMHGED